MNTRRSVCQRAFFHYRARHKYKFISGIRTLIKLGTEIGVSRLRWCEKILSHLRASFVEKLLCAMTLINAEIFMAGRNSDIKLYSLVTILLICAKVKSVSPGWHYADARSKSNVLASYDLRGRLYNSSNLCET